LRVHFLSWNDNGTQIPVRRCVLEGGSALLALQQQLHATEPALDLTDARNHAHRVQDIRRRLLGVVALCNGEHETVAFEGGFDCSQSRRPAGRYRLGEAWKYYSPPERENR